MWYMRTLKFSSGAHYPLERDLEPLGGASCDRELVGSFRSRHVSGWWNPDARCVLDWLRVSCSHCSLVGGKIGKKLTTCWVHVPERDTSSRMVQGADLSPPAQTREKFSNTSYIVKLFAASPLFAHNFIWSSHSSGISPDASCHGQDHQFFKTQQCT